MSDWTDDYPTTTRHSQQPYPVPEGWVLAAVDGDGITWHCYPVDGHDRKHAKEIGDVEPEETAVLSSEWDSQSGTLTHIFTIGDDPVFEASDPDEGVLWRAVAETMVRYSNNEDYHLPGERIALEEANQNEESDYSGDLSPNTATCPNCGEPGSSDRLLEDHQHRCLNDDCRVVLFREEH